ncbi:AraC family transcriptional regulator [Actinocorallia sp. B10E7]|uniref:AraC family transcriptional regulator n=1 Tax=Actinocorallia sp. B10E7 TaxID=3153558 RepID=UPI00325E574C
MDKVQLPQPYRLRSTDPEEARQTIGEAFCPHRLEILDVRTPFDVAFRASDAGGIGLHHLDYGTGVLIDAEGLDDCYLIEIPETRSSQIIWAGHEIVSDRGTAAVLSPAGRLEVRRSPHSPQLIIRLDKTALDECLGRMLGRFPDGPLLFAPAMRLDTPPGRSLVRLARLLSEEVEDRGGLVGEPSASAHLRAALMTHLLLSQPHTYSTELTRARPAAAPRTVRRALEFIESRAAEPITVADIAAEVSVSVRVLQEGFRRHVGRSPTEQLRTTRLERVRRALLDGDPETVTVTSVAARWGFHHLGRFAADYRRHFGEAPSVTLRCAGTIPTSGRTGGSTLR